jgi:hypothetical protein
MIAGSIGIDGSRVMTGVCVRGDVKGRSVIGAASVVGRHVECTK